MLMDMFYRRAAVAKKKRVHFNAFMLDIHDSMWSLVVHVHGVHVYTHLSSYILFLILLLLPPFFSLTSLHSLSLIHAPLTHLTHSLSLTHSPSLMPPTPFLIHSSPSLLYRDPPVQEGVTSCLAARQASCVRPHSPSGQRCCLLHTPLVLR